MLKFLQPMVQQVTAPVMVPCASSVVPALFSAACRLPAIAAVPLFCTVAVDRSVLPVATSRRLSLVSPATFSVPAEVRLPVLVTCPVTWPPMVAAPPFSSVPAMVPVPVSEALR